MSAVLPQEIFGEAECTLASLVLRYQDSPIDLEPEFAPYIDSYMAKLDWSFEAFSVDARPDTSCEVDGVPPDPTNVPIGGSAKLTLFARHADTGAKREYVVTAYRRLGSETELRSLSVDGGELSPIFSQRHREYVVRLDLSHDVARIVYVLMDNEQRLTASAQEERPKGSEGAGEGANGGEDHDAGDGAGATSGTGGGADADVAGDGDEVRRLLNTALAGRRLLTGEVQFREGHVDFMLDVGFSRIVTLTVQCADPTQASISTYTLSLSRPSCTLERPYFDPEKKVCVNFCSSGYYRNRPTHRCSRCNENCLVCSGLLDCDMCLPDTEDFSYIIEPDGKCRAVANHLFRRYRWWCLGFGVLLFFLVLMGCCGCAQMCCSDSGGRAGRFARLPDTDSDEGPAQPQYASTKRFARY